MKIPSFDYTKNPIEKTAKDWVVSDRDFLFRKDSRNCDDYDFYRSYFIVARHLAEHAEKVYKGN